MRLVHLLPCVLAACSGLSPGTLLQMQALDPLTVDPASIEVALILPPGLTPRPGGARLEMSAARGDRHLAESFTLAARPTPGIAAPAGGQAVAFALPPEGVARMRAVQSAVAAWPQEGAGEGRLGVGLDACLSDGPLSPTAEGAVMIRLATGGDFLPLVPPMPVAQLIGPAGMAALQPCP